MKMLISILLSLFVSNSLFAMDLCSIMSNLDEAKFKNARIKSYKCQINWKQGKGSRSAEVAYMTNYCNQFEGGNAIDCLMTRTCVIEGERFADYGPTLFLTKNITEHMCEEERYFLYGVEGSKGFQAWVNCKNKSPNNITLKAPDGNTVKCAFPAVVH